MCAPHLISVVRRKMVRTQLKAKAAENFFSKSTRSKSIRLRQIEAEKKLKIESKKLSENLPPRITRSTKKEGALIAPTISPKKLRSKSIQNKKNELNSHSSEFKPQNLPANTKTQSKNSSLSTVRFIKLNDYKVNSIVLAKQKYSTPWPARVLKIEKNQVFVYFFSDKRNGFVLREEIYDFILSGNAIKSSLSSKKKLRGYLTGIAEIEMLLNIPQEKSLLN